MRLGEKQLNALKTCSSEESVKSWYSNTFELKYNIKNGIDLFIEPIIFEFKYDVNLSSPSVRAKVLAQCLYYVHRIKFGEIDEKMPSIMCLADIDEACFYHVSNFIEYIDNVTYSWNQQASNPDKQLINDLLLSDKLKTDIYTINSVEELVNYGNALKTAFDCGEIIPALITEKNFERIFVLWKKVFEEFYSDLNLPWCFIQDVSERVLVDEDKQKIGFIDSGKFVHIDTPIYKSFWNKYERPPMEYVQSIIRSCADRLMSVEKRRREGAYYTPEPFTSRALNYLDESLGEDWQNEYYIWDCCCGTGNLEFGLKSYNKLFMSTLEKAEIEQLINDNIFPNASIFQFDFLNDPKTKLPQKLIDILDNKEKIVFLINPPYADAGSGINSNAKEKKPDVANSLFKKEIQSKYGKAANELFMQFIARIYSLAPHAIVGIFSKTKMYTGTDFKQFREHFKGEFVNGFIFHCKAFVMAKGEWPVAFSILRPKSINSLGLNQSVEFDVLNEQGEFIGKKTFTPCNNPLSKWYKRPKDTIKSVPLVGAINVKTEGNIQHDTIAPNSIGYMDLSGNDLTQSQACFLASSAINHGHGTSVTPDIFEKSVASLAIRHVIQHTWVNDRDQFSVPTSEPNEEFYVDCIIWVLFSNINQTSSWTALYKNESFFIDNEWYPFSKELAQKYGPQRHDFQLFIKSHKESFVYEFLKKSNISPESKEVLRLAENIYIIFYRNMDRLNLHKYKIENYCAGWYQIRNALTEGRYAKSELEQLREMENKLKLKLEECFYKYGFFPKGIELQTSSKKKKTIFDY